jgi:transcriptional regulator with XRE-family HTH domain
MKQISSREEMHKICQRLRSIREAKGWTLLDVERKSGGKITAIALGSYERGDRQVSLFKLLHIAKIYELPASEILTQKIDRIEPKRITIDLRKLLSSTLPESVKVAQVLREIALLRGDWNGELMSIRATDLTNFSIFSGLTNLQIHTCISGFTIIRSK